MGLIEQAFIIRDPLVDGFIQRKGIGRQAGGFGRLEDVFALAVGLYFDNGLQFRKMVDDPLIAGSPFNAVSQFFWRKTMGRVGQSPVFQPDGQARAHDNQH